MKSFRTEFLQVNLSTSFLLHILVLLFGAVSILVFYTNPLSAQSSSVLTIPYTEDFTITGAGTADNWSQVNWLELKQRRNYANDSGRETSVKVLYSDSGIYFLFRCDDDIVSSTIKSHFKELWREDVVEVFLWPNESEEVYFEYELSPLNYELPILVSNNDGVQSHWIPFDYSYKNDRKTRHETSVTGGTKESGSAITEWRGEFYIPFELLRPLKTIFPKSGTQWRANMYRIDYDHGSTTWTWQPYENNFHDIHNYGTFIFE